MQREWPLSHSLHWQQRAFNPFSKCVYLQCLLVEVIWWCLKCLTPVKTGRKTRMFPIFAPTAEGIENIAIHITKRATFKSLASLPFYCCFCSNSVSTVENKSWNMTQAFSQSQWLAQLLKKWQKYQDHLRNSYKAQRIYAKGNEGFCQDENVLELLAEACRCYHDRDEENMSLQRELQAIQSEATHKLIHYASALQSKTCSKLLWLFVLQSDIQALQPLNTKVFMCCLPRCVSPEFLLSSSNHAHTFRLAIPDIHALQHLSPNVLHLRECLRFHLRLCCQKGAHKKEKKTKKRQPLNPILHKKKHMFDSSTYFIFHRTQLKTLKKKQYWCQSAAGVYADNYLQQENSMKT